MSTFHIRPAKPQDVEVLLQLITDLATYEREPSAVKATPHLLKKHLFEMPHAHALLAFSGTSDAPGEAVGFGLYFFNYSTWTGKPGLYLEDLYVIPEYRGHGIGKAFFGELGKIAQEKGCARIEWSVLKWNEPALEFYKCLGAKPMSEWMGMRLTEFDGLKQYLSK